jgi:hypothetical protein
MAALCADLRSMPREAFAFVYECLFGAPYGDSAAPSAPQLALEVAHAGVFTKPAACASPEEAARLVAGSRTAVVAIHAKACVLRFDLDLSDRTPGACVPRCAPVCTQCWRLVRTHACAVILAVRALLGASVPCYAFFSGRRGIHLYVTRAGAFSADPGVLRGLLAQVSAYALRELRVDLGSTVDAPVTTDVGHNLRFPLSANPKTGCLVAPLLEADLLSGAAPPCVPWTPESVCAALERVRPVAQSLSMPPTRVR